jgi:hypothetical protein
VEEIADVLRDQEAAGTGMLPGLKRRLRERLDAAATVRDILHNRRLTLAIALLVLGIPILAWRFPRAESPPVIVRVCADPACGHLVSWPAGDGRLTCPACEGERLFAARRCPACGKSFADRLVDDGSGRLAAAPCPHCAAQKGGASQGD